MSINVNKKNAADCLSSIGVAPGVLPEVRKVENTENLQSWVSTDYAPKNHPPPDRPKTLIFCCLSLF